MNICRFFKIRSKQGTLYYFCTNERKIVEKMCYKKCQKQERRKVKPINKKSKKKEAVTPETYAAVYMRCNGRCAICNTTNDLQLHHIFSRGKDKTNNVDNCIMLCRHCHFEVVHKNNKYWRPVLNEIVIKQNGKEIVIKQNGKDKDI